LDECNFFPMPDHFVGFMELSHSGLDAWKPEYVRVIFDDFTYAQCNNAELVYIDNDQKLGLDCRWN